MAHSYPHFTRTKSLSKGRASRLRKKKEASRSSMKQKAFLFCVVCEDRHEQGHWHAFPAPLHCTQSRNANGVVCTTALLGGCGSGCRRCCCPSWRSGGTVDRCCVVAVVVVMIDGGCERRTATHGRTSAANCRWPLLFGLKNVHQLLHLRVALEKHVPK